MEHTTASQFEVTGGETQRGDFVALVCKACHDGVEYWDKGTHGWPTLIRLVSAAIRHECGQ